MALNIKLAIKNHGLTSIEIANRMNINRVNLSNIINGNPTIDTLNRIANAIGCDVSELFDNPKNESNLTCPHCGKEIKVGLIK